MKKASEPSRSSRSSRRGINALLLAVLTVASGFAMVSILNSLFPDNHGYNRTVVFVRPEDNGPGYFFIIDEFNAGDDIELYFHSYGNLTINDSMPGVTFDNGGVEMKLHFIGPDVSISNYTGWVFTTYPGSPGNSEEEYIKVIPHGSKTRRLVTLVTFQNSTIAHPNRTVECTSTRTEITVNGSDKILFPGMQSMKGSVSSGGMTLDGNFCFYRLNDTKTGIEWCSFKDAKTVSSNGTTIISSAVPRSGMFNATTSTTGFMGRGAGNPVDPEPSTELNFTRLEGLVHPYALFNDTDLLTLQNKTNGTIPGPWQSWYATVSGRSDVLSLAFRARIDENQALADQSVAKMLTMVQDFESANGNPWEEEQYISQSTYMYKYLFAYDMIYNNISSANRSVIEDMFREKIDILADVIASGYEPTNNHIVVASAALGIGGIVLKNNTWIQLTQEANDFYLKERVRPNGPCFEGDIYGRYAYDQAVKFFLSLKKVGGYNYFTNPRFLKYLEYTVTSVTPLGWTPSFEDCGVKLHLANFASLCVSPVKETNVTLSKNLQWYFEFCYDNNTNLGTDVYRIVAYEDGGINGTVPSTGSNPGFCFEDSGIATIRTGWEENDTYLVISNKNYLQSHVHLDENSIEMYAMGKKFMTNPGYPHWRQEGHDYTIGTNASNTVRINGKDQLDVISDGFDDYLSNDVIDVIDSPCYMAYKSPFNLTSNPAILLLVIFSLGCMAFASLLSMRGWLKEKSDENDRDVDNVEENTKPPTSREVNLQQALFSYDRTILANVEFNSLKKASLHNLILTGIRSIGFGIMLVKLVKLAVYQIQYVNLGQDLKDSINSIAPIVELSLYPLVPLVLFTTHALFLGMMALGVKLSFKANALQIRGRESIGIVHKHWLLQGILFAAGIAAVLIYIFPSFKDALQIAQVDAGNNITVGVYLRDLLGGYVIYFLIAGLFSIPLHHVGMRVIDAHATRQGLDRAKCRMAFKNGTLIVTALLVIGLVVLLGTCFWFFSTISIEHNPLQ
ncbi:MAG: heparinase II/III domain-containing protein [Promethearchaeota archaeon]